MKMGFNACAYNFVPDKPVQFAQAIEDNTFCLNWIFVKKRIITNISQSSYFIPDKPVHTAQAGMGHY